MKWKCLNAFIKLFPKLLTEKLQVLKGCSNSSNYWFAYLELILLSLAWSKSGTEAKIKKGRLILYLIIYIILKIFCYSILQAFTVYCKYFASQIFKVVLKFFSELKWNYKSPSNKSRLSKMV